MEVGESGEETFWCGWKWGQDGEEAWREEGARQEGGRTGRPQSYWIQSPMSGFVRLLILHKPKGCHRIK